MKPHLAPKKGRWYIWPSREDAVKGNRPAQVAGRKTPDETLKAFLAAKQS